MSAIYRKSWDFAKGILLIGGCPVLTFLAVLYIFTAVDGRLAKNGHEDEIHKSDSLFNLVCLASTGVAFVFAVRHRVKHRILPLAVVGWEIIAGLLGAGGIFILLVFRFARIC